MAELEFAPELRVCVVLWAKERTVAMVCRDLAAARAWLETQGPLIEFKDNGDRTAEAKVGRPDVPGLLRDHPGFPEVREFEIRTWVVR